MKYVLKEYMGQKSTEELEVLLRQYIETEERLIENFEIASVIMGELRRRRGRSKEELAEQAQKAWASFLEDYAPAEGEQ